jgi:transcriptional regulator with XRE-family HTH domain
MSAEQWFKQLLEEGQNDPDYLTEEVLLDVTEQIYRRMQEAGLRPSDVAERLGVSRAFVSQLLNGKPNMTMRTLVGVAHALDQRVQVNLRPAAGHAITSEYNRPFSDACVAHDPDQLEVPQAA